LPGKICILGASIEMAIQSNKKFVVIAHIAGWLIFFFLPILLSPGPGVTAYFKEPGIVLSLLLKNVLWMALFYFNLFYLTPIILQRKGVGMFLLSLILIVVIFDTADRLLDMNFPGRAGHEFRPPPAMKSEHLRPPPRLLPFRGGPMLSNLLLTLIICSVSTLIVLWNNWQEARAQEQERALQKYTAELSILKLQISPHFLFNTLNNIRWLIRSKSDQAEVAVVKLSQLMRYILYQTDAEKVPLENEVDHLKDFVSLQQLRLPENSFTFSADNGLAEKYIVPLLLIPLAENFFKYGNFDGSFQNNMALKLNDQRLRFSTKNKIMRSGEPNDSGANGIGLQNIRQRLILHYPSKHSLKIYDDGVTYKLEMEITLD
jgi:hypothetical protein